ncbi:hypothetical protein [Sanguibacter gelidistatuariae]|nr:hypothetical protein [Sanguibacter gelidistatuariae]
MSATQCTIPPAQPDQRAQPARGSQTAGHHRGRSRASQDTRRRSPGTRSARLVAILATGACAALLAIHGGGSPPVDESPAAAQLSSTAGGTAGWTVGGAAPWSPIVAAPGDLGAVGAVVESVGDFVGALAPGAESLGASLRSVTVRVYYTAGWWKPVTGRW